MTRSVNLLAILAPLSLAAATSAVAASAACCVLPLTLAAFGAGGAWMSALAPLPALRPALLTAAGLALVAAWIIALQRRDCDQAACAPRGRRGSFAVLAAATLLTGAAGLWRGFEDPLTGAVLRLAAGAS